MARRLEGVGEAKDGQEVIDQASLGCIRRAHLEHLCVGFDGNDPPDENHHPVSFAVRDGSRRSRRFAWHENRFNHAKSPACGGAKQLGLWRSLGDSNPCFRRERATS